MYLTKIGKTIAGNLSSQSRMNSRIRARSMAVSGLSAKYSGVIWSKRKISVYRLSQKTPFASSAIRAFTEHAEDQK